MAARTNRPNHNQKTRDKIQASQLINSLQNHVFGKNDMDQTQISAANILLKKTLPDLQSVEVTGEDGGPVLFDMKLIDLQT